MSELSFENEGDDDTTVFKRELRDPAASETLSRIVWEAVRDACFCGNDTIVEFERGGRVRYDLPAPQKILSGASISVLHRNEEGFALLVNVQLPPHPPRSGTRTHELTCFLPTRDIQSQKLITLECGRRRSEILMAVVVGAAAMCVMGKPFLDAALRHLQPQQLQYRTPYKMR